MPVPALSADSEVAQLMPPAPRSWMPTHEAPLDQLEAGLDQQLLRERVAHLDGGALVRILVRERGRGEDAGPADAVAPGRRAEQHDVVALARGLGEDQVLLLEQADRHHVDERVALVRGVEDELAADGGNADAVAVAADAAHDAVDEVAGARIRRVAEAERVEDRDRARAHREDVAQDAAHAGGGALVRLHRGGVVVALDLERHGQPVADPDHAGVVAGAGHHAVADRVGRVFEERLGALVRAVLAPHHAEHGQLGVVGVAAELPADDLEFVVGDAEAAMKGDRRLGAVTWQFGCAELRSLARRRRPVADSRVIGRLRLRRDGLGLPAASQLAALVHQGADQLHALVRAEDRPRPSAPDAASGPATLPAALQTPAMARSEPLGLAGSSGSSAGVPSSRT